jgi:predicted ATP-grasp superfamily ATP-dependent carboligase
MSKRLILVGASVRACAASAVKAGFAPEAFDLFADADLRALCPTTCLVCGYGNLDTVFSAGPDPWMYTGGLENRPRLIDRLALLRPLWGISGQALRHAKRPWHWCRLLRDAGFTVPDWVSEEGPRLVKPLAGAGGKGVEPWLSNRKPAPWRAFLQERIGGDCSVSGLYCALENRVVLLGVTRQMVGAPTGPFAYRGSIGPLKIDTDVQADMQSMGSVLGETMGLRGLFGVDGILTATGFVPVEINPRYPASAEVVERATGMSMVRWHAAAFGLGDIPAIQPPRGIVAKEIIYASRQTLVPEGLGVFEGIADIPDALTVVQSGWPILTCLSEGADELETMTRLKELRARVEQKLANSV